MMEEATPGATPPAPPASVNPDREQQYRRVGLTKEVLSVHTQKEEQAFLTHFKNLSQLHVFNSGLSRQEMHQAGPHTERSKPGWEGHFVCVCVGFIGGGNVLQE